MLRPPNPEYLKLIAPFAEPVQALALAARRLILEEAPQASELIYEVYTIASHYTFTGKGGGAFVFTTTHAKWVNLGFNFGSTLPDPFRLLRGEGKWIRHVRIEKPADLAAPGVRELIRAATGEAERPETEEAAQSVVRATARSGPVKRRSAARGRVK